MKTRKNNRGVLQALRYLYHKIVNTKIFNIQRRKLIFKPWRKRTVFISNLKYSGTDGKKHWHRPFTRPVPEKQTSIEAGTKPKPS